VFPVNATGSSGQPNIVGFNNLYSGSIGATGTITNGSITVTITAGAATTADVGLQITGPGIPANDTIASITGNPVTSLTLATAATASATEALTIDAGMCNRTPVVGVDDGISATTIWSYNITATGGQVATSPALSLDGTKVAFVETGSGATAHFHVLAPKSGDGVAANLQSVTSPLQKISSFATSAPGAGSGTVTDLALGSSGSYTLYSPFVDYINEVAYVGNDSGMLFRIVNVFCTLAACTGGGSPAPSLDTTWGTAGALATGCTGLLTGPVVAGTGNVFVGCSDGKLYGFTPGGTSVLPLGLTVGNGGSAGGIVDPPLVDVVHGFIYVVSGSSGAAGPSVLVQASATDLSSPITATLGAGGHFNLHAPAFNNAYFSSSTSTDWLIYEWALDSGDSSSVLYGVGFNASPSHSMKSGAPANTFMIPSSNAVEFSPLTEILNGSTDRIFNSGFTSLSPNLIGTNINAFPTNISSITGTTEGSGTSGIVVDNVSNQTQASSVYFGAIAPGGNGNSAVKLTQSRLQ
jgi:hypothetical protein